MDAFISYSGRNLLSIHSLNRSINPKIEVTTTRVTTVESINPPMIAVLDFAASPNPSAIGTVPIIIAREVIKIGLSRTRPISKIKPIIENKLSISLVSARAKNDPEIAGGITNKIVTGVIKDSYNDAKTS